VQFSRKSWLVAASSLAFLPFAVPPRRAGAALTVNQLLARLFTDTIQPSWLSASITDPSAADKVKAVVDSAKASLGMFNGISYAGGAYFAIFPTQRVPIYAVVNDQDQLEALWLYPPVPLSANETATDVGAALSSVWTSNPVDPNAFTSRFLHDVPSTQVDSILATFRAQLGAFDKIQFAHGAYFAVYANGSVPLFVYLAPNGRIDTLLAFTPQAKKP